MTSIGIDPGRKGAAVVIRHGKVLAVLSWYCRTRDKRPQYVVKGWPCGSMMTARTPHQLGRAVATIGQRHAPGVWRIGVEDVFVGRNVKTTVRLARWAGAVSGPLEDFSTKPALWAMAHVWRSALFKLSPFTGRVKAKQATREFLPAGVVDRVVFAASEMGCDSEDLLDAAGIALWTEAQE